MSRNYRYFRKHFEGLTRRHGGGVVVIAGGRLVGTCRRKNLRQVALLVERARRADPLEPPFVAPVPTVKELGTPLLI